MEMIIMTLLGRLPSSAVLCNRDFRVSGDARKVGVAAEIGRAFLVGVSEKAAMTSDSGAAQASATPVSETKRTLVHSPRRPSKRQLKWVVRSGPWPLTPSVSIARESLRLDPENLATHVILCTDYGLSDSLEQAREVGHEILRIAPSFSTLRYVDDTQPYKERTNAEVVVKTLREAGLPK
jgi:hypothetical protein